MVLNDGSTDSDRWKNAIPAFLEFFIKYCFIEAPVIDFINLWFLEKIRITKWAT